MKNILIVVDMQNDFIDGALGTKEAVAIVPKVEEKIRNFDGEVFFTRDTHETYYLETQEGKNLPVPHCIKGTAGWEITEKLDVRATDLIIDKISFGFDWAGAIARTPGLIQGDAVEFVGLCTDICVISNALSLKTALPEIPISVDASCCAGVTPESHANALEAMKMCQIEII